MKQDESSTAVATKASTYPVCDPKKGEKLAIIMKENVGQDGGANLLDRITMPSGKGGDYQVPGIDGELPMKEMEVVIGLFNDHRVYFEKPFGDGGSEKPDCHSEDMDKGVGAPGGDCHACPFNEYESADKGKGKACSEKRLLMLFLPGRFLPIKLDAPPTSLQNIRKYFLRLASEGKLYRHVVTKFALEKDKSDKGVEFSKIAVSYIRDLTADEKVGIDNYVEALRKKN